MNVGHWLDTMGIQNPAKTKGTAPRAPARPSQAAQPAQAYAAKATAAAGSPAKRVRKAPNPEMHLAQLSALLESHGELLSTLHPAKSAYRLSSCSPATTEGSIYTAQMKASK